MSDVILTPGTRCDREWHADGKDHRCVLPHGHHSLVCACDCGERKWQGKPLPEKFRKRRHTA